MAQAHRLQGLTGRALVAAVAAAAAYGVVVTPTRASGQTAGSGLFDMALSPAAMTRRAAATADLQTTLSAAIQRTHGRGTWGVIVVSLTHGDTLFGHNADQRLLPASTMKLFTSALALEELGPEGRFETQLLHTGTIRPDGVLEGNLILRGAGDPTLGARGLGSGQPSPMVVLARAVAAAGITQITGALVGDPSGFEDGKVPDGWRSRYLGASYAARVSALSFNENQVTVLVGPGSRGANVTINPPVSGIDVRNTVQVVAGSRSARIRVSQDSVAGRVIVSGWIGARSRVRGYKLVVENPELFAVGALKAALQAEGVRVDGPLRVDRVRDSAETVASLPSPPVEQIVNQMNGESNNHFAELLFRNVARLFGARGTAETANSLLGRFLAEKVRVPADAVYAADGSGLSTLDRVTPRAMVHLLDYARSAPWGPVFEQSLPIAGRTETLARRMRRTPAMGNLRAKTGTTNDVASLGGYVTAGNGEDLAFSIIYNGPRRTVARDAIDRMGVTLASFSR